MEYLVSFVIPVRDDAHRLRRCLLAIGRTGYPSHLREVIVIDNGSVDGSDAIAWEWGARTLSVADGRVSELRNRGVSLARGQVLAFVDADHEIGPRWAPCAIETLQRSGVGAVGALYRGPQNGTWVHQMYDALRGRRPGCREVEWLPGGNMAVWRTAFEQIGGFDPSLEACEDVDFCQRLRAAGLRVISDDRLESVHAGDPGTLGALFRGELWRGRGSLRASFRGPMTLRTLPSVVIPVGDLGLIGVALAGLASGSHRGLLLSALAAGTIAAFASLRAALMLTRRGPITPLGVARAWVVAVVYDFARALALVTRARHPRARPMAAA